MAIAKKTSEEIKTTKSTTKTNKVVNEEKNETKELQSTIKQKDKEINDMKKQFEEMQKMMLQMQSQMLNQQAMQTQNNVSDDSDEVEIVSYMWGSFKLKNSANDSVIEFLDAEDVQTIPSELLSSVLTPDNKKLFYLGLLAFVGDSEKYYKIKKIQKRQPLSDEYLLKVLESDYANKTKIFDDLTNRKTDDLMITVLCWRSIRMLAKSQVDSKYDREVRGFIKEYFGINNLDWAINLVDYAKDDGFIH